MTHNVNTQTRAYAMSTGPSPQITFSVLKKIISTYPRILDNFVGQKSLIIFCHGLIGPVWGGGGFSLKYCLGRFDETIKSVSVC